MAWVIQSLPKPVLVKIATVSPAILWIKQRTCNLLGHVYKDIIANIYESQVSLLP